MNRLLATIALFVPTFALAAPPAGSWKVRVSVGEKPVSILFALSQADGKWVGDFLDSRPALSREPKIASVTVTGDAVRFTMAIGAREFLNFDGVLAKDGKKIAGSFSQQGGPLQLLELAPTKLKKFDDPFDINRETFDQIEGTPAELFDIGFELLPSVAMKKLPPEEVRGLVERLAKGAATFGPRWDRHVAMKVAGLLVDQAGYSDIALAQARRAERLLAETDPVGDRLDVLDILVRCLTSANKADEAKPLATQIARLEARDAADAAKGTPFGEVGKFAGRKGKSNRVVLVEGFVGTEFPLSAPIEQVIDVLGQAYTTDQVIALNLHYHLPQPSEGNPLTVPETSERLAPLIPQVERGQFLYVAGKPGPRITNPAGAKEFLEQVREQIDKTIETVEPAQLKLAVAKGAKGFDVKATVTDLNVGSNKMVLRFAVVEPRVRYAGSSGVRYHANVVRAWPGGPKGYPLTKAAADQTVTVEPIAIRESLVKSWADFLKNDGEFPRTARPLELKGLKVVAFIQNDSTGDVLTATIAPFE
jgi:hypothetical protein